MFDDHAPPDVSDPVCQALRGLALAVRDEVTVPEPAEPRHRTSVPCVRHRRLVVPSLAAAVALIVGVALAISLTGSSGHRPAMRVATHATRIGGITLVSDNLNQLLAQAPTMTVKAVTVRYPDLDANHAAIAFGAGSVWVLQSTKPLGGTAQPLGTPAPSSDCGVLVRLDPATTATTGTLPLPTCPIAVAFGDGSVWVLSFKIGTAGYRLAQIDPATMSVRSTTTIDGGPDGVTPQGDTGAKYLYVTATPSTVTVAVQTAAGTSQIVTLDATTHTIIGSTTIPAAHGEADALAGTANAEWIGTTAGWLYRIDPTTGATASERQLGVDVTSLSASAQSLWLTVALPVALPPGKPPAAYPGFDTLELDPTTGAIRHDTGLPLVLVSTEGTQVWGIFSSPQHGNYIAKIDPATHTVEGATSSPFTAAFTPDTISVSDETAWVINTNLQTLTKVSLAP